MELYILMVYMLVFLYYMATKTNRLQRAVHGAVTAFVGIHAAELLMVGRALRNTNIFHSHKAKCL